MEVRYSRRAIRDLDAILAYVSRDNPTAASKLVAQIRSFVMILAEQPGLGRKVSQLKARMSPVPRTSYLVFFRTRGSELQILQVRHGKRRPLL